MRFRSNSLSTELGRPRAPSESISPTSLTTRLPKRHIRRLRTTTATTVPPRITVVSASTNCSRHGSTEVRTGSNGRGGGILNILAVGALLRAEGLSLVGRFVGQVVGHHVDNCDDRNHRTPTSAISASDRHCRLRRRYSPVSRRRSDHRSTGTTIDRASGQVVNKTLFQRQRAVLFVLRKHLGRRHTYVRRTTAVCSSRPRK